MSVDAKVLRKAAREMRDKHGPDHPRHEMWDALATSLVMHADHVDGQGSSCLSCIKQGAQVARKYLEAVET